MKKLIIGLVGFPGSGKTTVASYLKAKRFFSITLSDIIKEEAVKDGIQTFSREFLQEYGNLLRVKYGPHFLAERALTKIRNGNGHKIVIDGIRNVHEIQFLKEQDDFFLIGIDSPSKERYQRLVDLKGQEWTGSYEHFLEQEEKEKELGSQEQGIRVEECMSESTYTIDNDGDKKDLFRRIDAILETVETKQNRIYRIVLLGVPGSGKGTQGELLSQKFQIPRLSVGALIRRHCKERTKAGEEIGGFMVRGEAIPAETYSRIVTPWLLRNKNGFVVDNLVRTKEQLESFRRFQKTTGFHLTHVFYLRTTEEEARRRLAQRKDVKSRPDENEEAIHRRFLTFVRGISEIREYFESLGIFYEIEADRSEREVHRDILQHLSAEVDI